MPGRAAPLALVGATVAVSVSAILIAEARTDAATVVWLRMTLTVLLLSPWAIPQLAQRRRRPVINGDLGLTIAAGAFLALHFLTWTASLADTSVAASVLLVSLHPLLVIPLGAWLFGDHMDRPMVFGGVLALGGTVITCAGGLGTGNALRGDLLAIAGGAALAAYLLIGRSRRTRGDATAYSALAYTVVAAAGLGAAALSGHLHAPDGRAALACLGLAVICTIGGHTVFNWVLHRLPAATVSLSFLGEPPLAALLAVLILGQSLSASTVVGGLLILVGLGVTVWHSGRAAVRLRSADVEPVRQELR